MEAPLVNVDFCRDSSISNLADTISSLEKQAAQMTAEKDDLLVKVQQLYMHYLAPQEG